MARSETAPVSSTRASPEASLASDGADATAKETAAVKVCSSDPKAAKAAPPASNSGAATRQRRRRYESAPRDGDLRTAVVIEAAESHRHSTDRLHRERPRRVSHVAQCLRASDLRLPERCCVFGALHLGSGDDNDGNDGNDDDADHDRACGHGVDADRDRGSDDTDAALSRRRQNLRQPFLLRDEDYLRVHLPAYMQRLDRISGCTHFDTRENEAAQYTSIYFSPTTVHDAKIAASSLCCLVSAVLTDDLDNGFALIRPPGHHAQPGMAAGFCILNNVAIAASYALHHHPDIVSRVLIVDWDVHHGNGTQSIFYNDPSVLCFSVHRHERANFYPFSSDGAPAFVGSGLGEGYNVNVAWDKAGMTDDEYVAVWECLLIPMACEYRPDFILVSAGFDAAAGDALGGCNVSPECFARLTRRLMSLRKTYNDDDDDDGDDDDDDDYQTNGIKIVCTLEGGYVQSVLARCVESVVGALLDGKSAAVGKKEAKRTRTIVGEEGEILDFIDVRAAKCVRETIQAHWPYWKCLNGKGRGQVGNGGDKKE